MRFLLYIVRVLPSPTWCWWRTCEGYLWQAGRRVSQQARVRASGLCVTVLYYTWYGINYLCSRVAVVFGIYIRIVICCFCVTNKQQTYRNCSMLDTSMPPPYVRFATLTTQTQWTSHLARSSANPAHITRQSHTLPQPVAHRTSDPLSPVVLHFPRHLPQVGASDLSERRHSATAVLDATGPVPASHTATVAVHVESRLMRPSVLAGVGELVEDGRALLG